jgi:hypothetical protein
MSNLLWDDAFRSITRGGAAIVLSVREFELWQHIVSGAPRPAAAGRYVYLGRLRSKLRKLGHDIVRREGSYVVAAL